MQRSHKQSGFTLIELMVCLFILLLILSILSLNYSSFTQKAKQARVVSSARTVGNACLAWVSDQGGSPTLSDPVDLSNYPEELTRDQVAALLKPNYISFVPELDQWGNPWEYYFSGDINAENVFCLRSAGRDGIFQPTPYEVGPFIATDYDQDIVWADGSLVSWPG